VDKNLYPNYNDFVPLEMNITRLVRRIIENYYRTVEGLCGDIVLIDKNALKYNTKGTYITNKAKQVFEILAEHIRMFIFEGESLEVL
jgi:RNase P/RNase MRP subunit p29